MGRPLPEAKVRDPEITGLEAAWDPSKPARAATAGRTTGPAHGGCRLERKSDLAAEPADRKELLPRLLLASDVIFRWLHLGRTSAPHGRPLQEWTSAACPAPSTVTVGEESGDGVVNHSSLCPHRAGRCAPPRPLLRPPASCLSLSAMHTEPGPVSTAALQVSDSKQLSLWPSFPSISWPLFSLFTVSLGRFLHWVRALLNCLVQPDSVIPQTITHQPVLSMGFFWQEYWSGLPCPPPGDLPDPSIEPCLFRLLHCRWILPHWATREALLRL